VTISVADGSSEMTRAATPASWHDQRMQPPLPVARLVSNEPSAAAVRWVMRSALLMMIAFVVIVVFGHIPPA
jgi:hypothetical protein